MKRKGIDCKNCKYSEGKNNYIKFCQNCFRFYKQISNDYFEKEEDIKIKITLKEIMNDYLWKFWQNGRYERAFIYDEVNDRIGFINYDHNFNITNIDFIYRNELLRKYDYIKISDMKEGNDNQV